jgi:hypothetical protein
MLLFTIPKDQTGAFVRNSKGFRCAAEQNAVLLVAIQKISCAAEQQSMRVASLTNSKNFHCAAEENTVTM